MSSGDNQRNHPHDGRTSFQILELDSFQHKDQQDRNGSSFSELRAEIHESIRSRLKAAAQPSGSRFKPPASLLRAAKA